MAAKYESGELTVTEENVLENFPKIYSQLDIFQKNSYSLTKVYDTYWKKFIDKHSDNCKKLSKLKNVKIPYLESTAEIIRKGWIDEKYLPSSFPELLLRKCVFPQRQLDIQPEMVLDFIKDDALVIVVKKGLEERKTYCEGKPDLYNQFFSGIRHSGSFEDVCLFQINKIFAELDDVIKTWTEKLKDLDVNEKEFKFIMKDRPSLLLDKTFDPFDLPMGYDESYLPHKLWTTFLTEWNDNNGVGQVDFYFDMLSGKNLMCGYCGVTGTKHLLGNDKSSCLIKMKAERKTKVLQMIKDELYKPISSKGIKRDSFFYSGENDWVFYQENESSTHNNWPRDINKATTGQRPSLMVVSMKQKKVMMVEIQFTWDYWLGIEERKYKTLTETYKNIFEQFEKKKYRVQFEEIVIGSRGVNLYQTLYKLFYENFHINHVDISRTIMVIGKVIFEIPYRYYKQGLKRKALE